MNAVVLASGDSLSLFDPSDFSGMVVAVNRAAISHHCDVWACDHPLIEKIADQVQGSPILLSGSTGLKDLKQPWRGQTITTESLFDFLHPAATVSWTIFTATSAIVYAAAHDCQRIDCYGFDWSGTADGNGVEGEGDRSEARWKLESEIFAQLTALLAARGVEVRRIVAGQDEKTPS